MRLHNAERRGGGLFALRRVAHPVDVAFVAHDAAIVYARRDQGAGELDRLLRVGRAAAVHARVDLDDCSSLLTRARHALGKFAYVELALDCGGDIDTAREQRHQAVDLDPPDHLVGHENRPEPRVCKHFCFAQLGDGDADCARGELTARDLWRLRRLKVGAQLPCLPGDERLHLRDVVVHGVDVEQEAGCVEI